MVATSAHPGVAAEPMTMEAAAALSASVVLAALRTSGAGLTSWEVGQRRAVAGPNAVRSHRARWATTLVRQVRSPLVLLLAITTAASFFLGERVDALVIGAILTASVGLGFVVLRT